MGEAVGENSLDLIAPTHNAPFHCILGMLHHPQTGFEHAVISMPGGFGFMSILVSSASI
jgi:hypothetical protein